jgi:hypothetical protein
MRFPQVLQLWCVRGASTEKGFIHLRPFFIFPFRHISDTKPMHIYIELTIKDELTIIKLEKFWESQYLINWNYPIPPIPPVDSLKQNNSIYYGMFRFG